jgi:1-acyl-sn-glycerol-3-phosphate acyltransferase
MVRAFYRRCEVQGRARVPAAGPLIVCGNHASALADAVIMQAASPRPLHPLARSGLFSNPLLRIALAAQGAVPVYRPQDGVDPSRNEASFARCHERLAAGDALLIFPEGQSHSDSMLRPLKTGAARIALGAQAAGSAPPLLVPAGLTFTEKGKFRSSVLVQFGAPIDSRPLLGEDPEDSARRITDEVRRGLAAVTLNADAWEDVALIQAVQRFFVLRGGRYRRDPSLGDRLHVQQRLIAALRALRLSDPEHVTRLRRLLERFERLLDRFGVEDYHLNLRYTPGLVARFLARTLLFALVVFPLALWGVTTSGLPFFLVRYLGRWLSRGKDQYDSAKMLLGLFLVPLTWTTETWWIWQRWGTRLAVPFAILLPITAAIALAVRHERRRIVENARVFLLLSRKDEVRELLLEKRAEIERERARLARLSRHASSGPAAGR